MRKENTPATSGWERTRDRVPKVKLRLVRVYDIGASKGAGRTACSAYRKYQLSKNHRKAFAKCAHTFVRF
jgi:hypothetical protein